MKKYCKLVSCILAIMLTPNFEVFSQHYKKIVYSVTEVEVLDYPFMHDIVQLLRTTDHNKIFPQFTRPPYDAVYSFNIDFGSRSGCKSFYINGSYSICVNLRTFEHPIRFEIDGIRFYTYDTLIPYFNSCKSEKVDVMFLDDYIPMKSFWFFEVRDGNLIDAVYFFEPLDDTFDEYEVYDLIHKKYIPYKNWKTKIKSL